MIFFGHRALACVALLPLALLLVLGAASACGSIDEHDILGALAASPPPEDVAGNGGGDDDDTGGNGGGTGECDNAHDLAILSSQLPLHPTVTAIACKLDDCGDDRSCIETCVISGGSSVSGTGLTRDCARCFATAGLCVFQDCSEFCDIELASDGCNTCFLDRCLPDYCDCIGEGIDSDCAAHES